MSLSIAPPIEDSSGARTHLRGVIHGPGLRICMVITAAYAAIMGAASIQRWRIFGDGGDLLDYLQVFWNTSHGRLLQMTNTYSAGSSYRSGHVEPITVPLSLLYGLLPSPPTLLILQTVVLAVGAPLAYLIARVHGHGQGFGVVLATLYLLFPHVQYANMHEFHMDPIAVPFIFATLLSFELRRWKTLWVCLVLSLLVKEQVVLITLGMGAYWWIGRGERAIGLWTIVLSMLYGALVIAPWFLLSSGQFTHDYNTYFSGTHQSSGFVGRIQGLLSALTDPQRRNNIVLAFLPSGFLFLFDASALMLVLPVAALYVATPQVNDIWWHHYVMTAPLVMYSTSRALRKPRFARSIAKLSLGLIVWSVLVGYMFASQPIDLMHWVVQPSTLRGTAHSDAETAFVRYIPADVALAADPALATHVANRAYLYKLYDPKQVSYVPYVALDLHTDVRDYPRALFLDRDGSGRALAYMRSKGGFRLLRADYIHGLYLYANCGAYPRLKDCR